MWVPFQSILQIGFFSVFRLLSGVFNIINRKIPIFTDVFELLFREFVGSKIIWLSIFSLYTFINNCDFD